MKKILTSLALSAFIFSGISVNAKEIEDIIPSNVQIFAKISSIDSIYSSIGLKEKIFFGNDVAELGNRIIKKVGINLVSTDALKKSGLDTASGASFSLINFKYNKEDEKNHSGIILLTMPVKKDANPIPGFIKQIKLKNKNISSGKEDGIVYIFEKEKKDEKIYFTLREGHLLIIMQKNLPVKEFIASLDSDKKLSGNQHFIQAGKELAVKDDIILFVNINELFTINKEMFKTKDIAGLKPEYSASEITKVLEDFNYYLFTMKISGPDLVIHGISGFRPGSGLLNIYKNVKIDRKAILSITENPILLISAAFDITGYINNYIGIASSRKESYDSAKKEFLTKYGVDIEKDLIQHLDGNMSMAVFDGKSFMLGKYNTAIVFGVKNPELIEKFISTVLEKQKQQNEGQSPILKLDGLYYYNAGVFQIVFGVKNGQLIFASSKDMFDKAATPAASFTEKLTDKDLAGKLNGNSTGIFYLDPAEILFAINNLKPLFPQPKKDVQDYGDKNQKPSKTDENLKKAEMYLSQFSYLIFTSSVKENSSIFEAVIKTKLNEPLLKFISKQFPKKESKKPSKDEKPAKKGAKKKTV